MLLTMNALAPMRAELNALITFRVRRVARNQSTNREQVPLASWARSGKGTAWDGLSFYNVSRYNPRYLLPHM
jgi:hypothetical protein